MPSGPELSWMLLLLLVALLVVGVVRFDVLKARWGDLFMPDRSARSAPPPGDVTPQGQGMRPHAAPAHKPAIHRSGRRH